MRVENRPAVGQSRSVSRSGAAGTFRLDGAAQTPAPGGARAAASLGGVEALVLLQGEEDPLLRRRRAATRGRGILDALDRLKLAILAGRVNVSELSTIRGLLAQRRDTTSDPALDDVLAHIELRAEVELAKLGRT